MANQLFFVLISAAVALVWTRGTIFRPLRELGVLAPQAAGARWLLALWRELASCSLCSGVWVGLLFAVADGGLPRSWPAALLTLGLGALAGVLALFLDLVLDCLDYAAALLDERWQRAEVDRKVREQAAEAVRRRVAAGTLARAVAIRASQPGVIDLTDAEMEAAGWSVSAGPPSAPRPKQP